MVLLSIHSLQGTFLQNLLVNMDDLANLAEPLALHDKVARLKALLDLLFLKQASRIPSPASSIQIEQERSSSGSLLAKWRDNNREMSDQLMQTNIQLMKLATVALGTVGIEQNRFDQLKKMNTQLAALVTANSRPNTP
jgi:hypothetical protein